jgi:hypothetical protein
MILLTLSTVINDVTVEIQGEANDLDQIQETWETFVLTTYQVENGSKPGSTKDLRIQNEILTRQPIVEVP